MNVSARNTRPAVRWCFVLGEITAPAGGLLFKEIGHTSTWAAVSVGLAPYMISVLRYMLFVIVYFPAAICYLRSDQARQDNIRELILLSANVLVSLQTLIPINSGTNRHRTFPASTPEPRVLEGLPDTPSEKETK